MAKVETRTLKHDSDTCPYCAADFRYVANGIQYSRLIGISSLQRDCIVAWKCPDCGKEDERVWQR
jgi:transposase-like protein